MSAAQFRVCTCWKSETMRINFYRLKNIQLQISLPVITTFKNIFNLKKTKHVLTKFYQISQEFGGVKWLFVTYHFVDRSVDHRNFMLQPPSGQTFFALQLQDPLVQDFLLFHHFGDFLLPFLKAGQVDASGLRLEKEEYEIVGLDKSQDEEKFE